MKKRTKRLEIYKSKRGYSWRLRGANGEIMSQGESYTRKYNAILGATRANPGMGITDLTGKAKGKK